MKKRKYEEENSGEPEDGECSESENDDTSVEITPDPSVNSESDREEEQGFFVCLFTFQCFLFIRKYVLYHWKCPVRLMHYTIQKVNKLSFGISALHLWRCYSVYFWFYILSRTMDMIRC